MFMKIGYGQIFARDPNPNLQHETLSAAGCDQIFVDKAGNKPGRHPELTKALMVASRKGDQLVVTRLDRLGRSLEHLGDLSADLQDRGVDLVVLEQGIDTSTEAGRVFFEILDTIADFEHSLRSERRRGWFP